LPLSATVAARVATTKVMAPHRAQCSNSVRAMVVRKGGR